MKPLPLLFFLPLFLCQACVKEPAGPKETPGKTDMSELVIPESFTWSGVNHSDLTVTMVSGEGTASTLLDGQPFDLLDADGNRIARTVIEGSTAQFIVSMGSDVTQLFLSLPVTQTTLAINLSNSSINFSVPPNAAALFAGQPDSDADGMPDAWDEYPDDPDAAYSYHFPAMAASSYTNLRSGNLSATGNLRAADGTGYYFQIFEDLWPEKGDYDLNDLIMMTRIRFTKNRQGYITSGSVRSRIWAIGASTSLPHGFGWEFLKRDNNTNISYLKTGTIKLTASPTGAGTGDITSQARSDSEVTNGIILFDNVLNTINPYYNNVGGAWGVAGVPQTCYFEFTIKATDKIKAIELLAYMYKTADRSLSVRTFGTPPAQNADLKYFGARDDASASPIGWNRNPGASFTFPLAGENAFYRTSKNLPWAVEFIASDFLIPIEKTTILKAYPDFQKWAESGGAEAKDWFERPDMELTLEAPK